MQQIIDFFTLDKFSMLELIFWTFATFGITLWGCISAIKDNEAKRKNAQKVLIDEMHKIYLKNNDSPADVEERENALSYLESLNVDIPTDGKA